MRVLGADPTRRYCWEDMSVRKGLPQVLQNVACARFAEPQIEQ